MLYLIYSLAMLHLFGTILLVRATWQDARTYSIPITIHNVPILGIWALILAGCIWLSLAHPWIYLVIGFLLGMFQFIIESIEIPDRPRYALPGRILSALSVMLLWPELASFTIFCIWHADKIPDEEPKS